MTHSPEDFGGYHRREDALADWRFFAEYLTLDAASKQRVAELVGSLADDELFLPGSRRR